MLFARYHAALTETQVSLSSETPITDVNKSILLFYPHSRAAFPVTQEPGWAFPAPPTVLKENELDRKVPRSETHHTNEPDGGQEGSWCQNTIYLRLSAI